MNNTQLLKIAQKHIGQGGAVFRKYCGLPSGAAWCNAFVDYVANEGGVKALYFNGAKETYCPHSIAWCKKNLAEIPLYLAMPMDIIYFDWDKNGVPNHIGFVRGRKDTSSIYTIEGNTDGGRVAQKTRAGKYVQAVYRPHFKATYNGKALSIDGHMDYQSIGGLQKALSITPSCVLDKNTVMKLQKLVGASPDGAWGNNTSLKTQRFLIKQGFLAKGGDDSAFGPNSVKALQRWINSKVHPQTSAPKPSKPVQKPTTKPTTETRQKMKKIGHARCDYDHKAGDSSGKEVCQTKFTYNPSNKSVYDWTYCFRPKSIAKANKAAAMCEKACANNAIGYNSNGKKAYGNHSMDVLAPKVNYDLSKIKTKSGLSCGDLICLCNRWAGLSKCYQGSGLGLAKSLKKNSNFECIPYKKGMQLYRGDVLITAHSNGKNNHVVMCL